MIFHRASFSFRRAIRHCNSETFGKYFAALLHNPTNSLLPPANKQSLSTLESDFSGFFISVGYKKISAANLRVRTSAIVDKEVRPPSAPSSTGRHRPATAQRSLTKKSAVETRHAPHE
ncbi:hypothetical protein [Paraburkholderia ultramafica]|uniref:hypothetical protein n=1 Tax=Paraburkholderia ultramafica TaxID=1544867 RepID=UPI0015843945